MYNFNSQVNDSQADPFFKSTASLTRLSKRMSSESSVSSSQVSKSASSHDSLSISGATASLESAHTEGIFPTPPRSPGYQISAILSPSQYILEASKHINLAAQYEADEKFEDAFCQYKLGIDILLKNGKGKMILLFVNGDAYMYNNNNTFIPHFQKIKI